MSKFLVSRATTVGVFNFTLSEFGEFLISRSVNVEVSISHAMNVGVFNFTFRECGIFQFRWIVFNFTFSGCGGF